MFFISSDTNLEPYSDKNVMKMLKIGSTRNVNVVAFQDHARKPARRFFVMHGTVEIAAEYSKIDSASTDEIVSFVKWAHEKYPADHYLLGLWNHSGGWYRGRGKFAVTRLCYDAGAGSSLKAIDLPGALKRINEIIGHKIDILGLDCSLAQTIENCYEIKDYADFAVSSQEDVPPYGWPYDKILEKISGNPFMKPADFASAIVYSYGEYYSKRSESVTQSAVDLSRTKKVVEKIDALAESLAEKLATDKKIYESLRFIEQSVQVYTNDDYCDLVNFCMLVNKKIKDEKINAAATALINAIISDKDKLVFANITAGASVTDSNGISIHFPKWKLDKNYEKYRFGRTKWKNLIESLFSRSF